VNTAIENLLGSALIIQGLGYWKNNTVNFYVKKFCYRLTCSREYPELIGVPKLSYPERRYRSYLSADS